MYMVRTIKRLIHVSDDLDLQCFEAGIGARCLSNAYGLAMQLLDQHTLTSLTISNEHQRFQAGIGAQCLSDALHGLGTTVLRECAVCDVQAGDAGSAAYHVGQRACV